MLPESKRHAEECPSIFVLIKAFFGLDILDAAPGRSCLPGMDESAEGFDLFSGVIIPRDSNGEEGGDKPGR